MKILKYVSAVSIASTLTFGVLFSVIPSIADAALTPPSCVLNTIVQPTNNGGTTLSWKVYNSDSVTISGIGSVSDADATVVYPNVTTIYTLTATGKYGTDTCSATVYPASSYSFGNYGINTNQAEYTCSMWVNPDLVVPGGTGILSWNAGSASNVYIDKGIGNVSSVDSRVVPNFGVPQTFTLNAKWGNGITRTCSATVQPLVFGGTIATQRPNIQTTYTTYTPATVGYVAINQIPNTGTRDIFYLLTLLVVMISSFTIVYKQRKSIALLFTGKLQNKTNDFERTVSNVVITKA